MRPKLKHLDSTAHFMVFYLVKTFRSIAPTPLVFCKEVELKELCVLYTLTVDTPRTPTYEALQVQVNTLQSHLDAYRSSYPEQPYIRTKLRETGHKGKAWHEANNLKKAA